MKARTDNIQLTIAIPTYNRLEKLRIQIERLLPQLSVDDVIIVIDNASTSYSHEDLMALQQDQRIFIHRNKINIGANANVLKCFECVNTEWMWLLSDDDVIFPNSLEIIRGEIINNDVDFINFSSELLAFPRNDVVCRSLDEYVGAINSGISNHLLMSNNVYRLSSFLPYLSFSYWGVHLNAPHLTPVFMAMQNGSKILLSSKAILTWGDINPDDAWRFSNLYNLLYLPDLISDSNLRAKAINAVIKSLPAPEKLIAQLSYYKKTEVDSDRINDYSKRILHVYAQYGGWLLKIRSVILSFAIKFPNVYLCLLDSVFRIIKHKSVYGFLQKGVFQFYI